MKNLVVFGIILLLFNSCGNKANQPPALQGETDPDKQKQYFPVLDFLKSEIRYVDSLPIGIMKYSIYNGLADSGYIKHDEFHRLAESFTPKDLSPDSMEKAFEESSFFDNTTNSATFFYSARDKNQEVQRIHVLAKPDAAYDRVTHIYIEKIIQEADSMVIQKMTWKPRKQFQINTEVKRPGKESSTTQVKVIWDNREEDQ